METGAKSCEVLNGRVRNRLSLTAVALDISSKVWPSGSALATISPATMPPAPGLFSITTAWPSVSPIFWATTRAVTSATPPAPNGTTMRTGLVGKFCAKASGVSSAEATRAASKRGNCMTVCFLDR
ncbi:hypothetical protein D3C78_1474400 [compost metagenome]